MVFPHLPAHAQPNRSCPFSNCTPTMLFGKASTAAPVSSIFSLITSSLLLWWLFAYCSQDLKFCSLMPRRQSDEGAPLRPDDRPQPFDFFHRPNGHDQVDGALAQTPEEKVVCVEAISLRPIQSRNGHLVADEPDALLPEEI